MADIQFEEESRQFAYQQANQKSLFIRIVLATKIVSTDKAAKYVLLGIALLLLIFAIALYGFGSGSAHPLTNQDIERIIELQRDVQTP